MAIAKISKINIIARLEDQEKLMEAIQDSACLQIEEQSDDKLEKTDIAEKISKNEYRLAGAKFGLAFLAEYNQAKKSLSEKLNFKMEMSEADLKNKVENFNFKIFKEIQETQKKINEANSVIEKSEAEIKQLSPWKNLSFIPRSQDLPENISYKLLSFSLADLEKIKKELEEKITLSEMQIVEKSKKGVRASLVYHTDYKEPLSEILNNPQIKTEELPEIETDIENYIKKLETEIKEQQEVLEAEKKNAQKLAEKIKDLKIIFDYLSWEKDRLLAQQKALKGWQIFSIIGWIETEKLKELEKKISAITKNFVIKEIEPEEDEQIPIAFENSWWSKPFEFVTGVYGAPKNGSPDPTPFLMPFFVVFFGLCLTDAGYGVILALLAFLLIKFGKPSKEAKKMFLVLLYGGLATFVAGAFVGGWFGIVIDDMGDGLAKSILTGLRLIDPVKDPITMLLFSLGLGVVQIITGIIISLWWKVKNNNLESAILDDAMWLYFLGAMLVWGGSKVGVIDFESAKYLVWAGVAGIVLTQGRKAKNPIIKLVSGVISLYGLVGYLSDILSYSRLLALGLATGIIAMVVNLIASLTVDMIPYAGYAIAGLVIIGGHIFNIAINALGSFIHSSRLQFVEFFPKFMEGGGVNLTPVKKENKYTKII